MRCGQRGVTLVELVIVMTLLGIITAVAAISLRDPITAYRDTQRRAELTDVADGALRRMAREIRRALPNSIRVNGNNMELLLTRTGGRYRNSLDNAGAGDFLDLAAADVSFDTIGPMNALAGQVAQPGDILVVFNLFSQPGVTVSNAYTFGSGLCALPTSTNCNTTAIAAVGPGDLPSETKILFAARRFPQASPGNRFQVVEGPVTYACVPGPVDANGDGTGTLRRVSGYPISLAQPAGPFGASPILANYVTACAIVYNPLALVNSLSLVSMQLTLTRGGEAVTLYHEVHVTNIP